MALRWLVYGVLLAGALLLQIFNTHYLAHFLLLLVVMVPLLSLAVSLPAMCTSRLELTAVPGDVRREEPGRWEIALRSPLGLPLSQISCTLRQRAAGDGREWKTKTSFRGVSPGEWWSSDVSAAHCDLFRGWISSAWCWDYLGLFPLPLRRSGGQVMRVIPIPEPPGRLPEGLLGQAAPAPAPHLGGRRGEDYEVRAYRPGDPIRLVHWKLSSKWDELMVRESARQLRPTPVLTLDHFGTRERLDQVLDRTLGWSQALLGRDMPHQIQWLHPNTGELRSFRVTDSGSWDRCLGALLSDPCPPAGRSVLEMPLEERWSGGPCCPIHVRSGEEERHETAS